MKGRRKSSVEMDRLLAAALRPGEATDGAACPDVETLAAFVERGLVPEEVRRIEIHAAGCARCQATLAALVRLAPAPASFPGWLAKARAAVRLRWTVPVAAAATAAAPSLRPSPAPPPPARDTTARNEARGATGEAGTRGPSAAAQPASESPAAHRRRELPAAESLPDRRADVDRPADEELNLTVDARVPAPVEETATAVRPLVPKAAASAPAPSVPEDGAKRVSAPPSPRAGVAGDVVAGQVATAAETASGAVGYRVGGDGLIERSVDGGRTWEVQASGVTVDLSAVSAPAATIGWAVGARGVVLRTVDGEHWVRVSFPELVDLVAVDARDGDSATVTSADGRRLATNDAGKTWRPSGQR